MTRKLVFVMVLLAGTVRISGVASGQNQNSANEKQSDAQTSRPAPSPEKPDGDYVGSEVCVTCHAEQQKSFEHTIMGRAMAHAKSAEDARGCESCHGPGKAHVDAGGGKDTIPVRFTPDSHNT